MEMIVTLIRLVYHDAFLLFTRTYTHVYTERVQNIASNASIKNCPSMHLQTPEVAKRDMGHSGSHHN
jgi:hypothetical protein